MSPDAFVSHGRGRLNCWDENVQPPIPNGVAENRGNRRWPKEQQAVCSVVRWGSPLAAKRVRVAAQTYTQEVGTRAAFPLFFREAYIPPMKSMLVIERSEISAKLFAGIFEKRGWEVDACCNRESAIERLAGSKPYDAILLSYRVPGANAVELVGLIRALEHRRMTAVLMMISNGETTEQAFAAGADEVLLKPVNPNALIFAVGKYVW